ncbi:trypsin-like serine peptidase [Streptomyces tropicalis]|uniref:Peptidase S1 domain-containing protein n=1 Tax=Streptomyces tropicalis TaxID=3034234 RepID=A0ABT6ACD4_9ACTN|nr:trypsin-like serine protease [Streptomyces tropicalis]MDF3302304.1 hypothetical protein [Streptomyces tropicalis]
MPHRRIRLGPAAALCAALVLGDAAAARAAAPAPAPAERTAGTTTGAHTPGGTAGEGAPMPTAKPTTRASTKSSAQGSARTSDDTWSAQDAIRFWTRERMAMATDPSGRTAPPPGAAAPHAQRRSGAAQAGGAFFGGMKSVGVLFATDKGMKAHYCTASVVSSPGRDLVLTAGHCRGDRAAFVPMYDATKPAGAQPYGIWPVKEWFRDTRYASDRSPASDLDFAFASLQPGGGREVQDVVGANTIARTPDFVNKVTVVGYPTIAHNKNDQAFRCRDVTTAALPAYNQMRIDCAGMWGGVSGGPWFSKVDASGSTGEIIGNVGGFLAGGPDVPSTDPLYNRITYSPLYGDRFLQLYADARQGLHTDHGPYRQPPLPYSMGDGTTWKHARLLASGDFGGTGHSDMVVVWTDGETTLYTSDGAGRFVSERRLLAANSAWTQASAVTAGNFTGSDRFDLMVRWSDGRVTLHPDVAAQGLKGPGTRMIGPNKTWQHATQLSAGRFDADPGVDDLVVRWSDGELSLYTGVRAGAFGTEHMLTAPNPTWSRAALLTAGEFSGKGTWDLMAQWPNGELDTYAGTSTAGLGARSRVRNGGPWTRNTVMTTGNFTGDHRTDDLVVRAPDGSTTLYPDTAGDHLGPARTLVPHA